MKTQKHEKRYEALPNGGRIVCSCGWESPSVDESSAFTLGRKIKSPDAYFAEHVMAVETTMESPAEEHAVGPAQKSVPRKKRF